jgi:N-acetylglucosaminyl-diphospho-decaprenol L-rhamnosyltransferase
MQSLDIIIVNWNAGQLLRQCMDSIRTTVRNSFELRRIIVVDNASTDQSLAELDELAVSLTVVRNLRNRGFAAASNQGAYGSEADYLLFLNPDTRLFQNSLEKVLTWAERPDNARFGIVGVTLKNNEGATTRSCARFPTPATFVWRILGLSHLVPLLFKTHLMAEWNHNESRQVPHVCGAFYLVRRCLFEEIGGFDERFFLYLEDVDFSLRASHRGWATYYLSSVEVLHIGGGCSSKAIAERLFWDVMSRLLYSYKHFTWLQATSIMIAVIVFEPLARMIRGVLLFSLKDMAETIEAYTMVLKRMPALCSNHFRQRPKTLSLVR